MPPNIDVEAEASQLEKYWNTRNQQLLADRAVLALTKPAAKKNITRWVMNDPKVMFDTTVALLSTYPPRFRLPLSRNFNSEERERMAKVERFLTGLLHLLEGRYFATGRVSFLRELAYWVCGGWYAAFFRVHKPREGVVEFIGELFDPITVYPEWDHEGLRRLARVYEVDGHLALAMAENWGVNARIDDPQGKYKIINFWKRISPLDRQPEVYNIINVGGTNVKEITLEEGLDHIPILVGAIGQPEKTSDDWQRRVGESVIAADRDMYEYKNEMVSLAIELVKEQTRPDLISKSHSGRPVVKKEDIKGKGTIIPVRLEESLAPLRNVEIPAELHNLLSIVEGGIQRGGLPYIVYGGLPFELSGFAISQLMAAIKYKAGPYANAMESFLESMASEFLLQYGSGSFPPVELSTTDARSMRKGLFFVEGFKKSDMPKTSYVEATIPLTSAMDRIQQMAFARQALQPPQILSRETLWDEIFDVQDPDGELDRIMKDQTLELPGVKQVAAVEKVRQMAADARTAGDSVRAKSLTTYADFMETQLRAQTQARSPEKTPGMKPEEMPPEMGAESPDMARAALGLRPPGVAPRKPLITRLGETQG